MAELTGREGEDRKEGRSGGREVSVALGRCGQTGETQHCREAEVHGWGEGRGQIGQTDLSV